MRSRIFLFSFAMIALAAAPVYGQDLTLSLDNSGVAYGSPLSRAAEANFCDTVNCALFTGTIDDIDQQDLFVYLNSQLSITFSNSNPSSDALLVDNTFGDNVYGTMSSDPDFGLTPYIGPIFGIDIAPNAPLGVYTGTIDILGNTDALQDSYPLLAAPVDFTVVVTPEPAPRSLLLAGLAALAAWYGVKRKWRSSELSR